MYLQPSAPLAEFIDAATLETDQLDRLVPRLDRQVREALRTLPSSRELDDVKCYAARCRIELRRRRATARLAEARRLADHQGAGA